MLSRYLQKYRRFSVEYTARRYSLKTTRLWMDSTNAFSHSHSEVPLKTAAAFTSFNGSEIKSFINLVLFRTFSSFTLKSYTTNISYPFLNTGTKLFWILVEVIGNFTDKFMQSAVVFKRLHWSSLVDSIGYSFKLMVLHNDRTLIPRRVSLWIWNSRWPNTDSRTEDQLNSRTPISANFILWI